MNEMLLSLLLLLPATIFLLCLIPHLRSIRINTLYRLIQTGIYLAIIGGFSGLSWVSFNDPVNVRLIDLWDLGLTVRIDTLSVLMFTMIAIIGLVVVRYSRNYMDGEVRHHQFISSLAFTIAFVQLLVISGNIASIFIAWVGTSIELHRLLMYYPDRKRARVAARKKFVIARIGDLSLMTAFILIYRHFGTGDLSGIFEQARSLSISSVPFEVEVAGILLVISAALKSVQIPFHGWLLDVMEAPTPVSALLHAGLLNAGPFLMIRFGYVLDITSTATLILIVAGAMSALFGALTAVTQPTIKTALAYSSVGHMGFTLMVCGLGVYSASLLHLIAHSFYKAHAFLSSGSVIEKVQTKGALNYQRMDHTWRILVGILTAVALFLGTSLLWQMNEPISFQMFIIASIIFMGVLSLHIQTFDSNLSIRSTLVLLIGSILVVNAFYLFEHSIAGFLGMEIPQVRNADISLKVTAVVILIIFSLVVLINAILPGLAKTRSFRILEVHLRNGLYINQLADRATNSLQTNFK